MVRILFLTLFSVLFLSCSSAPKNQEEAEARQNLYNPQVVTPQGFSPEELQRIELLEKYRTLRLKKIHVKKMKKTQKRAKSPQTTFVSDNDLRMQIDQTLTYFCIKYESRFSRPEDCRAHADNVLKKCETQNDNVIKCLKRSL